MDKFLLAALVVACASTARPSQGQTPSATTAASVTVPAPPAAPAAAAATSPAPPVRQESTFKRFFKDVGHDYKNFFSTETAGWYAGGIVSAGLTHAADEEVAEDLSDPPAATQTALEGGDKYGNLTLQLPLALGWWVTGHAMGSSRGADAGRDLVRAQISATSWTYALKYAVDRDRPNGDPRSFPSGHAAATFATAMVLQDHYGWKVGVPFFAAATYTAVSRISVNKHWLSDVTMGAFVGIASARTVTLHVRSRQFTLAPFAVPGGGGLRLVRIEAE